MQQQTFDPSRVVVAVAGSPIVQYAKGTFITVEYDSDAFSDEVGAQGEVVRVRSADQRGTIKLTLMKASPSNDYLSALAATDRATGLGVGAALVKDLTGTSVHEAGNAWVKKIATASYGTEAETTEWEIRCAQLISFVGGTVPLS